jgi:parallel beta-helix repeat protein
MAKILLNLFLIVSLSITAVNAKDYYVAQNGIDANDGSENKPWRSIQKAARAVHAGDTVYIKNGTYTEIVTVHNSGSNGNYIIFKEYPGHTVILDGNGHADWHGVFSIYGKDYIKLQDIEIRNNRIGWGVLVEHAQGNVNNSATHVELSGLEVHHTGGEAIQVRGNTSNILIENCLVHDADRPSGIDIYQWDGGRPKHVTVRGCTAYNYPDFAGISSEQADNLTIENNISYHNELGIDIGSGDNNIIRNNTIYDCFTGIALSSNENADVYHNTIFNIKDEAIYNYYWSAHGEAHAGNQWHHNVIYNAGFGIYESNQKGSKGAVGPTSGHTYYHNLFYKIGTHGAYRIPFYFRGTTDIIFHHNTIYLNANYDGLAFLDGATDSEIRNNIISISGSKSPIVMDRSSKPGTLIDYNCYHNRAGRVNGPGTRSIAGDPQFVDPANNDFRLQKGSPCIGAGADPANLPQPPFFRRSLSR